MPNHWQLTTLGEAAEVEMGQSPPGDTYNSNGDGLPFLQGSAEFGERFPSPDRWCSAPTRVAEPGDLLVSVRAPVGDTNFADTRLAIGRGLARVRTTSVASSDFVRLVIQSEVGRLNQNAGGGMFASITARNLRGFRVALPPIPEQRRIVDLIGSIDSYSDNLQTQAGATRAARSALVAELLSKLGDDWRETTLGEISTGGVFTDGDWVESKDQDPEGTNRLLQLADVGDGVFLDKSDRWMRDDQFDGLRCTSVEADDVLIARMPDPIARACLVPSGLPRSCVAVDIAICRPPREVVLPRVLVMVLNDRKFRMEAEARATGSTRKRVSRKNLSEIRFFLPPLVDQARIAEVVDAIDEQVASLDSQIASVQLVRRGVLAELLSGERFLDESYDAAVSL